MLKSRLLSVGKGIHLVTADERWLAAHAFRDDLLRAGIRSGLSLHDAEEVASEAIIRAAGKADLDVNRVQGWLKIVASNLATDRMRARRSSSWLARVAHFEPPPAPPCHRVDDALEAEWVASLVAGLPARQRLVLEHRAAGRSPREIAQIMDCTDAIVELAHQPRPEDGADCVGSSARPIRPPHRRPASQRPDDGRSGNRPGSSCRGQSAVARSPGFQRAAGDRSDQNKAESVSRRDLPKQADLMFGTETAPELYEPVSTVVGDRVTQTGASRLGEVDADVATYSGIQHSRSEDARSFAESLVDCVERGLVVSMAHIGCREADARRTRAHGPYEQHEKPAVEPEHDRDLHLPGIAGSR